MRLSVHGQRSVVTDLQDLHARLAAVRARQWTKLDLGLDEDNPGEGGVFFGLIVLITGDRSFLTFFRYSGDAGFSSRDPAYTGPPTATLDFELSNGQVDQHPLAWTVTTEDALRVVEYAFLHRARAPWIAWHEDG